jgi:hypothetical protein
LLVSFFLRPSVSLLLSLLFIEQILLSELFGADGFALSLESCGGSSGNSVLLGLAATNVILFALLAFLGGLFFHCSLAGGIGSILFLFFLRFLFASLIWRWWCSCIVSPAMEAEEVESVVGEVVDSGASFGWDGSANPSVAWARLFSRLFIGFWPFPSLLLLVCLSRNGCGGV